MGGDARAPPPHSAAIKPLSPSGRHFKTISSGSPCKQGHDPKHAPLAKWALSGSCGPQNGWLCGGESGSQNGRLTVLQGRAFCSSLPQRLSDCVQKRWGVVIIPKRVSGRELSAPTTPRLQEKVTLRKERGCMITCSTYFTKSGWRTAQ